MSALSLLIAEEERLSTLMAEKQTQRNMLLNRMTALRDGINRSTECCRVLQENQKAMKNAAQIISLRRYSETVVALQLHRRYIEKYSQEISSTEKLLETSRTELEQLEGQLIDIFTRRGAYGQVIDFKRPDV